MKKPNLLYLLIPCALLFLWNDQTHAQNVPVPVAPVATVVETLPDGQGFIVEINGTQYRALSRRQTDAIAARIQAGDVASRELELERAQVKLLKDLSNSLTRQLEITGKQLEREREISASYKDLYQSEKDLRIKAAALIGKKSKGTIFFENAARAVSVATFILSTVK